MNRKQLPQRLTRPQQWNEWMDDWDEMDDSAYDGRSRRQSHDDDEPNGKKQSRRQRDNIRAQRRNKKRNGDDKP